MKKALLITPCEFIHQPRLLKTAEVLSNLGYEITILYSNISIVDPEVEARLSNNYKILRNCINSSRKGFYKYLLASLIFKLFSFYKRPLKNDFINSVGLNKNVFGLKIPKENYDVVYTNLIDTLYLSTKVSKTQNGKLIFDSQEYFKGQFSSDISKVELIRKLEKLIPSKVDILLTTTNYMADKYKEEMNLLQPVIRVRNVPCQHDFTKNRAILAPPFRLVWNGITINAISERGIHILVEGMQYITKDAHLYLSGNISTAQKEVLLQMVRKFNVEDRISLLTAFDPDKIIEELSFFHIGLIGEVNSDLNQMLTSSNKLFNYLAAGLKVVVSDLMGLRETYEEFDIGAIYGNGNPKDLGNAVNRLITDQSLLNNITSSDLSWEKDFSAVLKHL